MAAKVIPIADKQKSLDQIIDEAMQRKPAHDHPRVQACLKREVAALVKKHYSHTPVDIALQLPTDLSPEQSSTIRDDVTRVFHEHNERMIQRSNAIFLDLYLAKLELCELKYGDSE